MIFNAGTKPLGSTIYIPWHSFDGDGASVTTTGFIAGDVEIYKNGSTTQRSSDNGVTVSADFDSATGCHLIAIDTSDNTDAGFYVAGEYQVMVNAVTIDAQTVRFWAGVFTLGVVPANTTQLAGQTVTAAAGVTFPSSVASPTNITAGTITTVTNLTNAPTAGDLTATMKASVTTAATAATPTAAAVTGNVGGNVVGTVASVTGNVGGNVVGTVASVVGNVGGNVTGSIGSLAAQAKLDVNAEVDTAISDAALATATALATVDNVVDAIKAKTDNLPAAPAATSDIPTSDIAAIKAKTDQLTFTVAGKADANIEAVNGAAIDGTGSEADPWGPA